MEELLLEPQECAILEGRHVMTRPGQLVEEEPVRV